ncbi:MAG: hypothetical protein OEY30_03930 [Candidatus Bathyarchaeota archaeon]|nr:hypothetical protein [Candidatus Bathyarchaeota archaeon]
MNKALGYVVVAVVLGLALIIVPTYLFLVQASDQGSFSGQDSFSARFPLIERSEYSNHVEKVSAKELEVLGVSFVIASVVYVLFKRKTPRHDYMWPLLRSY